MKEFLFSSLVFACCLGASSPAHAEDTVTEQKGCSPAPTEVKSPYPDDWFTCRSDADCSLASDLYGRPVAISKSCSSNFESYTSMQRKESTVKIPPYDASKVTESVCSKGTCRVKLGGKGETST